jgi:hypothetical protein
MPTLCCDCRNLFVPTKNAPHWYWLCMAAPIDLKMNFVTGRNEPPYQQCKWVNTTGECPNFTPGFNRLKPPTVEEHMEGETSEQ